MKKLFVLGLGSLFALTANAQSLEERVEALEFKGYENFFKMSGQLEMRFDVASRETKDRYDQATDLTKHATTVLTNKGTYASIAGSSAALANLYQAAYDAKDCGQTLTTAEVSTATGGLITTVPDLLKDGCTTYGAGQKDANSFNKMFLKVDMESKPSDRMTFFGRLSMAKYLNLASVGGTSAKTDDNYYDFRASQIPRDSQVWVERAFVNYNVGKSGVFTFGRLPTISGPPTNLKTNQPWLGNYPLAAYSGVFDGMAYTHGFAGGQSLRFVYAPFALINFNDTIAGDTNENDRADTWTFMYEVERSVSWARQLHAVLMHSSFYNLGLAGSELLMNLDRTTLYAEFLGIKGTKWDFAFSYQNTKIESENNIKSGTICYGGWVTGSCDDETNTGAGYGFLVRYGIGNSIKVGIEYYANDKNTFAVDSANNEVASFYSNYGTGQKFFYVQDLDGGLKVQGEYTMMQTDYVRGVSNLIGAAQEVNNQTSVITARLISNF